MRTRETMVGLSRLSANAQMTTTQNIPQLSRGKSKSSPSWTLPIMN